MNEIRLKEIKKEKQRITYVFSIPDSIYGLMNLSYRNADGFFEIFIETDDDLNIENTPISILTIPFIGIFFGICLITDCVIAVDEIDAQYYECIQKQIKLFREMYNTSRFKIEIEKQNLRKESRTGEKAALFFTGGVDATSALASVIDEKPILINIKGGDIKLSDKTSFAEFERYFDSVCGGVGVLGYTFSSNCRYIFNEGALDERYMQFMPDAEWHGYWASIAHIIVMASVAAPLFYTLGISKAYFGSTYLPNDYSFDANTAQSVSEIRYADIKFTQIDANMTRIEKIENLQRLRKYDFQPHLQVCWYKVAGKNCSNCEKCFRTIMEIIAAGYEPNEYGFTVDTNTLNKIQRYLLENKPFPFWRHIAEALSDDSIQTGNYDLSWIQKYDFDAPPVMRSSIDGIVISETPILCYGGYEYARAIL